MIKIGVRVPVPLFQKHSTNHEPTISLPDVDAILDGTWSFQGNVPSPGEDGETPRPLAKLGARLRLAVQNKEKVDFSNATNSLGGNKPFYLKQATALMSNFFLTLPLNRGKHLAMGQHFVTAVKRHLGVNVTDTQCRIGPECAAGVEIPGDGDHAGRHAMDATTKRHTKVRNAIYSFLRAKGSGVADRVEVFIEPPMVEHFDLREHFLRDSTGEKGDILVQEVSTGVKTVLDVVISNPRCGQPEDMDPVEVLKRATDHKREVYAKWAIPPQQVVALAFTSYFAWSERTYTYLKELALVLAANEKEMAKKVFQGMKQTMAVGLLVGQGRVIDQLNSRNRAAQIYGRGRR